MLDLQISKDFVGQIKEVKLSVSSKNLWVCIFFLVEKVAQTSWNKYWYLLWSAWVAWEWFLIEKFLNEAVSLPSHNLPKFYKSNGCLKLIKNYWIHVLNKFESNHKGKVWIYLARWSRLFTLRKEKWFFLCIYKPPIFKKIMFFDYSIQCSWFLINYAGEAKFVSQAKQSYCKKYKCFNNTSLKKKFILFGIDAGLDTKKASMWRLGENLIEMEN